MQSKINVMKMTRIIHRLISNALITISVAVIIYNTYEYYKQVIIAMLS